MYRIEYDCNGDYIRVITSRIPEKYFKDLEMIQKEEKIDRAEAVRRLLTRAISEWKKERVLTLLKDHTITIRTAASMADVTYGEMLELAKDIDIGYNLEELERDLERF